jgi:hypothetical protein
MDIINYHCIKKIFCIGDSQTCFTETENVLPEAAYCIKIRWAMDIMFTQ